MRKILALLFVGGLCLSLCGCSRWWKLLPDKTESTVPSATTSAVSPVTVTVEGASGVAGDTVILPVTINANAGLVAADVLLHYDPALLTPVLQYDAATDGERYAEPGIFDGTVRSEKLEDGTMYVMLATASEGTTAKGTLFYVAFSLRCDLPAGALVTPEIAACTLRQNGRDVDAVAAGLVAGTAGQIATPTATATATATAAEP